MRRYGDRHCRPRVHFEGFQLRRRCTVSDSNRDESLQTVPSTIAAIVKRCEPMGDLGRFAIDDLTAAEEDEFFAILEDV
jgi:hypothetical protein